MDSFLPGNNYFVEKETRNSLNEDLVFTENILIFRSKVISLLFNQREITLPV